MGTNIGALHHTVVVAVRLTCQGRCHINFSDGGGAARVRAGWVAPPIVVAVDRVSGIAVDVVDARQCGSEIVAINTHYGRIEDVVDPHAVVSGQVLEAIVHDIDEAGFLDVVVEVDAGIRAPTDKLVVVDDQVRALERAVEVDAVYHKAGDGVLGNRGEGPFFQIVVEVNAVVAAVEAVADDFPKGAVIGPVLEVQAGVAEPPDVVFADGQLTAVAGGILEIDAVVRAVRVRRDGVAAHFHGAAVPRIVEPHARAILDAGNRVAVERRSRTVLDAVVVDAVVGAVGVCGQRVAVDGQGVAFVHVVDVDARVGEAADGVVVHVDLAAVLEIVIEVHAVVGAVRVGREGVVVEPGVAAIFDVIVHINTGVIKATHRIAGENEIAAVIQAVIGIESIFRFVGVSSEGVVGNGQNGAVLDVLQVEAVVSTSLISEIADCVAVESRRGAIVQIVEIDAIVGPIRSVGREGVAVGRQVTAVVDVINVQPGIVEAGDQIVVEFGGGAIFNIVKVGTVVGPVAVAGERVAVGGEIAAVFDIVHVQAVFVEARHRVAVERAVPALVALIEVGAIVRAIRVGGEGVVIDGQRAVVLHVVVVIEARVIEVADGVVAENEGAIIFNVILHVDAIVGPVRVGGERVARRGQRTSTVHGVQVEAVVRSLVSETAHCVVGERGVAAVLHFIPIDAVSGSVGVGGESVVIYVKIAAVVRAVVDVHSRIIESRNSVAAEASAGTVIGRIEKIDAVGVAGARVGGDGVVGDVDDRALVLVADVNAVAGRCCIAESGDRIVVDQSSAAVTVIYIDAVSR